MSGTHRQRPSTRDFTGQQRGENLVSSSSVAMPIFPDFRFLSFFYNSWRWGAEALGIKVKRASEHGIKVDRRHGAGPAAYTHAYARRRRAGSERKQSRSMEASPPPLVAHAPVVRCSSSRYPTDRLITRHIPLAVCACAAVASYSVPSFVRSICV
jgi:hypothetical protein